MWTSSGTKGGCVNVDEYSELAGEIQLLWDKVVVSMWTSSGTKVGCVNVDEYSELAEEIQLL